MEQPPTKGKVLYDDGTLRLLEEDGAYVVEYIDFDGTVEHRETYSCPRCSGIG